MSQNQHNPCRRCCDWTDGDEPTDNTDNGCCTPMASRRTCDAPIPPVPDCDEEDAEIVFDSDEDAFYVLTTMYDSECSPLADSTGSLLISKMA